MTTATARKPQRKRKRPDPGAIGIKVMSHPLRVRILAILSTRVASPSEIYKELDDPRASLGVVSYHVRRLEALGLLKLVRKTPRRGAIEHYYKATRTAGHIADDVLRAAGGTSPNDWLRYLRRFAEEGGASPTEWVELIDAAIAGDAIPDGP